MASKLSAASSSDARTARRRALAIMTVVMVLTMATWFSASAIIPQLVEKWDLSGNQTSLLTIAVQVGFVFGAVISAVLNLADVFPPKRVLWVASFSAAIANAVLVVAGSFEVAILFRFATGVALAGVYPVSLKLVSTWFREGRGTAMGILVGALTVGSAMPHLVNGVSGVDWQAVILMTSALTALGGVITVFAIQEGPFPFPAGKFDPRQIGQALSNRGLRLATLGYFGHMWELYAMWAWFLAFYGDSLIEHGGDGSRQAAALATFAVIGVGALGCWLGGVLGDRWGRTNTTSVAMAVSGMCALAIGFTFGGPPLLVLAVGLVWGISVVADSAQFSTIASEVSDQTYVGTALTMQLAAGFVLTVVTIWLIPVLRDELSWRWAFAFLAPGPALGIAAMLYLKKLPEARLIASGKG